ncbi:MAG TPA: beta-ketoacyl synthase N-terminal-like domain-containing protein [Rhodocyclaceae bacterium]|nr:beta-ketoacyl synthase N-terminal-like domain-containing protein [Rhodocyclaceae bacterium]
MTLPPDQLRRPVLVAGYGLASTLGPDLESAIRYLATLGLPAPQSRELVPGESWPHFPLAAPANADSWYPRAKQLIEQVVAECGGAGERSAPLFVASSSINIGAVELGESAGGDCLAFSERVAGWLDWAGPVFWINTACTSAINALASAQRLIESGAAESALVLGLEIDNRYSAAGFAGMQLLSPDAPQPLAAGRKGLVLGEAVAAVWLQAGDESESCDAEHRADELAENPGATVRIPVGRPTGGAFSRPSGIPDGRKKNQSTPLRWRLRGGANVVDGRDPAGASEAAVKAMAQQALLSAGLEARQIDLVKLQAAGSPHNDGAEIAGLREVFGELPALLSLKPLLGHTLGAAGAAELVLLLACLEAGTWPPQRNDDPDPALAARLAEVAPARVRYLLAVILGFGGGHAALVLEDTWAGRA